MNQSDEFEISVEVCDPKVIPGISKYVTYTLRGMDKNGQFDVQRRFSDFKTIRLFLVSKWPGCYIPPIPPRKAFGNMEQQFIDERMKMLQDFLRKIATLKYLWYAEEFQVFLKSQGELEKALQSIPKVTNEEIMNKYQDTFTDLSGREINREVQQKINDFYAFIRKVQPMIENFKQIAKNIEEAKSAHQQSLIHFILTFIPEYENNVLLEYTESEDKLIFGRMAKQEQMQELVNQYCDILKESKFTELYQEVRREGKQLKAFVQTFQEREKYELQKLQAETKQKDLQIQLQEILAGKTTLKTLFSSTKKEDQIAKIQQQIEAVGKEIENFQFICDILTVLVGYIEIDRFKVEKQVQYYQMMKGIIEYEIRLANITEEFWSTVLKSENLQQQ